MKRLLFILFTLSITVTNCNSQTKMDSVIIEREGVLEVQLNGLKKLLFFNMYEDLKSEYYKKNNININKGQDSICYRQLYIIDYSFTIFDNISYQVLKDPKLDILLSKWKNKNYMAPEYDVYIGDGKDVEQILNLKGDVLFMKALDFYESDDLKQYIDSLRQEGKKLIYNRYK